MKDGMIVQSGKYDELLQPGSDFAALVAAHDSSMESGGDRSTDGRPWVTPPWKLSNKTFIIVTIQSILYTSYIYEMHVLFISFFL